MRNLRALTFNVGLCAVILVIVALAVPASAADSQVGTWKLNAAMSKSSPGPLPKSSTVKVEPIENGYKLSFEGVDSQGNPTHREFRSMADGKDHPATGLPYADTIAMKGIDADTIEAVAKKGGKVTLTTRIVISKDGKTRTSTQTGKNEQGQDVKNILVYDKQ